MTTPEHPPDALRHVRRLLVGVVLLGIVVICFLSGGSAHRHFSVCSEAQVTSASTPTVTCRGLEATDPQVFVLVLAAMLLLLPDVKSLKIAGLVEIERSAARAADAADKASQAATLLSMQVQTLTTSSSQAVAHVHNYAHPLLPADSTVTVSEATLDEKERRFREQR